MGRGRAKAKQTKVARELKYSTQHTDFEALQRELSNQPPTGSNGEDPFDEDDYEDDDYRR
jgi:hypothetical protein